MWTVYWVVALAAVIICLVALITKQVKTSPMATIEERAHRFLFRQCEHDPYLKKIFKTLRPGRSFMIEGNQIFPFHTSTDGPVIFEEYLVEYQKSTGKFTLHTRGESLPNVYMS